MNLRMIPRIFVAGIILVVVTLPADAAHAAGELPRWRIQVLAYGPDQAAVVGIHHRLADRSELGLEIAGSVDDAHSDEGEDYEVRNDRSSTSISLRPEYRRWLLREDRLSTFWGWSILLAYSTSDDDREAFDPPYTFHRESESLSLGSGFVFGANLELLPHLSVMMQVVPATVEHLWRDTKQVGGSPTSLETRKLHDRDLRLNLNLEPALYACLHF